jgi:hypothetical protein
VKKEIVPSCGNGGRTIREKLKHVDPNAAEDRHLLQQFYVRVAHGHASREFPGRRSIVSFQLGEERAVRS